MTGPAPDQLLSLIDPTKLLAWMDSQHIGQGPIENLSLLAGGTQNILAVFTRSERQYVLRRPPLHLRANSNEAMRREARVLAAIASSDVPHPKLIAGCGDESVLGCAFYLMNAVDGFNASVEMPDWVAADPSARQAFGLALVDAAAALGRIDPYAVGLQGFGRPEGFLERQVARWGQQLDSYSEHAAWPGKASLPGIDEIAHWLTDNRPQHFVPGIIHGDFHIANVLFDRNQTRVAAVVDWELATLGDPLLDLGWLLATWPQSDGSGGAFQITPWEGFPTAEELVARYARGSTRDVSGIRWYEVLACYKLAILQEGTTARALAGLAPKDVGDRLHGISLSLLERALCRINTK